VVQASVREVCGMVPLEALACGTTPVLSDIPPFRRLTDDGRVGRLFPVGDAAALADALVSAAHDPVPPAEVRRWFDGALSFDALSDTVDAVYRSITPRPTTRSA
jgi:glycosyltransferase involved in cell wall biosynthesis